jgi:hypothetical protein
MVERLSIFFHKKSNINKILALDWRGCFGKGIKWDPPSFFWTLGLAFGGFALWLSKSRVHGQRFRLWTWPLETSHYARPKAPIPIFYWLFLAHLFGLSTKIGHSIPQPLDLGDHSMKRPLCPSLSKSTIEGSPSQPKIHVFPNYFCHVSFFYWLQRPHKLIYRLHYSTIKDENKCPWGGHFLWCYVTSYMRTKGNSLQGSGGLQC